MFSLFLFFYFALFELALLGALIQERLTDVFFFLFKALYRAGWFGQCLSFDCFCVLSSIYVCGNV